MAKEKKFQDVGNELRDGLLVPHSIEAEEATLGSILLDPECFFEIQDLLTPEDFFLVRHGFIWAAMTRLAFRRDPVDQLTVVNELEQTGQLSEVGGAAYIIGLINKTPSALNVEGYARIVQRMALRRRLIEAAQEVARVAHSDETEIEEVQERATKAIDDAVSFSMEVDVKTADDRASRHYDRTIALTTARALGETLPDMVNTGLIDLDKLLGGLQPDNLYYLAGRPGMGKTSFLDQVIKQNVKAGRPCLLLSYEMSAEQIDTRMLSNLMGVTYETLASGNLTETQGAEYVKAVDEYSQWSFPIIDDVRKNTPATAKVAVRQAIRKFGIKLLCVDYVQLMKGNGENRNEEISEVSRWLKMIAREFHIPVLAAAQLSRQVEQRSDKRPLLSDLRESGTLEQDADGVLFLYRDSYYDEDSPEGNKTEVHLAKHRNGPTGTIDTIWMPERMEFFNAKSIRVSMDDIELEDKNKPPSPLERAKQNPPPTAPKDFQAAAGGDDVD